MTLAGALESQDWAHFRGPRYDGSTVATPALATRSVALELVWRRPLGSGFAVPIVAGERVIASFSDGHNDVVAAFDRSSGDELWRATIAPTYRGHDGSADGPNAAPTSDGERVFALAPRGELVAVDLDSGAVLWRRHLASDFGGEPPHYGYAISPLVAGNAVVIQGGGPGSALVALDRDSGEPRWRSGDLLTDYASPVLATLGGERQILALGRCR